MDRQESPSQWIFNVKGVLRRQDVGLETLLRDSDRTSIFIAHFNGIFLRPLGRADPPLRFSVKFNDKFLYLDLSFIIKSLSDFSRSLSWLSITSLFATIHEDDEE